MDYPRRTDDGKAVNKETVKELLSRVHDFGVAHGPKILVIASLGLVCATFFVVREYRAFSRKAEQLVAMQDEYQSYVLAAKKVMVENTEAQERIEELEALLEKVKKNANDDALNLHGTVSFPEGARVVSSDDDEDDDSFVWVNRDLGYLRQQSFDYCSSFGGVNFAKAVQREAWADYTQQVLGSLKKSKKTKRVRVHKARRRIVARPMSVEMAVDLSGKRDLVLQSPIERHEWYTSSLFGARRTPFGIRFHYGLDMAAVKGVPVHAAADGVVVQAERHKGFGNTIVIAHNQKYKTRYAHLDSIGVRVGMHVHQGRIIGRVGNTGNVRSKKGHDPSHLHFEVIAYGKRVNPMHFLST